MKPVFRQLVERSFIYINFPDSQQTFNHHGELIDGHTSRGRAAKLLEDDGFWYYEVWEDQNYAFCGDEGELAKLTLDRKREPCVRQEDVTDPDDEVFRPEHSPPDKDLGGRETAFQSICPSQRNPKMTIRSRSGLTSFLKIVLIFEKVSTPWSAGCKFSIVQSPEAILSKTANLRMLRTRVPVLETTIVELELTVTFSNSPLLHVLGS